MGLPKVSRDDALYAAALEAEGPWMRLMGLDEEAIAYLLAQVYGTSMTVNVRLARPVNGSWRPFPNDVTADDYVKGVLRGPWIEADAVGLPVIKRPTHTSGH